MCKKHGPVSKKHEMQHFVTKTPLTKPSLTFDQKKKIYVKIGYSGYDSGQKRFIGYRPFKGTLCDHSLYKWYRNEQAILISVYTLIIHTSVIFT